MLPGQQILTSCRQAEVTALSCLGAPRRLCIGMSSPGTQAALAEATRLDQEVAKLCDDGAFQEAAARAERSLALRESVVGPVHRDVAASLNNLAMLYQHQAAYDKAEPLLLRALQIYEQATGTMDAD